jgi:replicative DNA helicase
MHTLRSEIEADDFSTDARRRIWARMCDLYDRGDSVDYRSVPEELDKHGELESVGNVSGVVELTDGVPKIHDLETHVRTMKDYTLRRRMIFAADHVQKMAFARQESTQSVLDAWVNGLVSLTPRQANGGPVSARELIGRKGVNALLVSKREHGVRLPWHNLDTMLWGFQPGQLIVLAAATSRGKTSLALQCAVRAAVDTGAIYFSREMGNVPIFRRAVNQRAGIDSDLWRHDALSESDRDRMRDAVSWLHDHPIYFDETSATVPAIHAAIRRVRAQQPVGLVVIDYLQLLTSVDRTQNRVQEVSKLAWHCKTLAMEFGIPVLLLSQFSRDAAKSNREPELWDLKESGDIENHCDVALLLRRGKHKDEAQGYRPQPDPDVWPVDVYVAKQREGRRDVRAMMVFESKCQRFKEYAE